MIINICIWMLNSTIATNIITISASVVLLLCNNLINKGYTKYKVDTEYYILDTLLTVT